jgi:hypothetical protein
MGFPFLWTQQGSLEHMNPALFVAVPARPTSSIMKKFLTPERLSNMAANQHALVSPYDVFWSMRQLAELTTAPAQTDLCDAEDIDLRGKRSSMKVAQQGSFWSVFDAVPPTRTCADAGIEGHFCKCWPRPAAL